MSDPKTAVPEPAAQALADVADIVAPRAGSAEGSS